MPAADSGSEEVLPEMNQRSSARTARRKTRLVVRRGRMGVGGAVGSVVEEEGLEREKRRAGGAKRERVPVPVLGVAREGQYDIARRWGVVEGLGYRSGRCSPLWRMLRMRWRYWCSSCLVVVWDGGVGELGLSSLRTGMACGVNGEFGGSSDGAIVIGD